MTEPDWKFPILAILAHNWVTAFRSVKTLRTCGARPADFHRRRGMLLIDASGRSFEVTGVRRTGPSQSSRLGRIIEFLVNDRYCTVTYDLEMCGDLTLDEVKARVIACIEADPDSWCDDELTAGEDGEPVSEDVQTAKARARVRGYRTLRGLANWIAEEGGEE